jgi:mannose-6-phosphate isomerase-like protein (cupin superfamily)
MKDVTQFINSGILQAYVLGVCDAQDIIEVEQMSAISVDVRNEIDHISEELERNALANAVAPDPIIKPMLMATIDFMERMENGEQPSFPPALHEQSTVADYHDWLNRADMVVSKDFKNIQARIIGYSPEVFTAIVWIKEMAPQEVHDNEFEKFLIVEGTCNITIGDEVHQLVPGNFLQIPLHKKHHVTVTSDIPCKVILQRIAA